LPKAEIFRLAGFRTYRYAPSDQRNIVLRMSPGSEPFDGSFHVQQCADGFDVRRPAQNIQTP